MMRSITIILIATLAACGFARTTRAQTTPSADQPAPFAAQVDLKTLAQLAIHGEGRVKSLDSHARAMMQFVSGAKLINKQPALFTYFDMMLRPMGYTDADVVWVKLPLMRAQIIDKLKGTSQQLSEEREKEFQKSGLISPRALHEPAVTELLGRLATNVITTAKFVEMIDSAFNVMNPDALRFNLKLVAPPGGTIDDPWLTLDDITPSALPNLDESVRLKLAAAWADFQQGWSSQDAVKVNAAIATLAAELPHVNAGIYPQQGRLSWEAWYFRMKNMTWIWLIYAFALAPLLLSVIFRWRGARFLGMGMFLLAFGLHTFAVMLRWYVADRWPNSNMFEAVTTAAWFGGCLALLFEIILRRSGTRSLWALGSATASMTALMAVHFLPLQLNPNISNMMPVLNDVWLYIHTNVIIFSYCLIFIAAVTATLYLGWRAVLLVRDKPGVMEYARVGGAGSLILTRPDGSSHLDESRSTFGQVLDGTTMVLMELSFIMLWAGLVMGAIWADHSWGRPWGWDPKEVFALNTFLVFLVLVHVRLKVKDKGLWTAILAVIGAGVMLFNWIIINFAISGLHSYA